MSSGIVEPSKQQQESSQTQQSPAAPSRSKLIQRLLDASANLPQFMKDLLTTQAVVVAGTEAAAFLVERQGEKFALRPIHHIRPDDSDQEIRANALRAFQNLVQPCVAQSKDGAIEVGSPDGGDAQFCLVTVLRNEGEVVAASAVVTRCRDMERAKQRLTSMQLVAGYFELFSLRRYVEQARAVADRHQQVLQYSSAFATAEGFESGAMGLCNELATRTGATRVALGWLKGRRMRVKALSHTEKFDKKQELIVSLERVMEECYDQEEPTKFDPDGEGSQNVTRMAREHSTKEAGVIVYATPLRRRDEIVGVMVLEFPPRTKLDPQAEAAVAVGAELLAPQLFDRYENDRWLPVKAWHSVKHMTSLGIGPRHMGAKLIIALVLAAGLFVGFYKPMYKVHASFVVHATDKRSVCPPYEGQLERVAVKPGNVVEVGTLLAKMRTTDYETELASYEAEVQSKRIEAQDKMGMGKASEAAVLRAQANEAEKKADLLRLKIKQAEIRAEIAGVVIKSDFMDRAGSAVRQSDVLFEIAKTNDKDPNRIDIEIEMHVPDRDIQDVRRVWDQKRAMPKFDAQVSTTTFPAEEHRVMIDRIVPMGEAREGENVFKVYGKVLKDDQPEWMRPGLTGEARVHVENRRLFWIWTHRLQDWIRLKLWL